MEGRLGKLLNTVTRPVVSAYNERVKANEARRHKEERIWREAVASNVRQKEELDLNLLYKATLSGLFKSK